MNIVKSIFLALFIVTMASCGASNSKEKIKSDSENQAQTEIIQEINNTQDNEIEKQEVATEQQDSTLVKLTTDFGEIVIYLYDKTPMHKENFIKLVKEGFYNGTLFHRVIQGFMIQGGDPNSKGAAADAMLGNGGPGYTLPAEITSEYYHKKGAVAAARLGDAQNPERESSGSQFYIVQGQVYNNSQMIQMQQNMRVSFSKDQKSDYTSIGGTPHLDGQYTVFGEVIKGLDVIDKIAAVKTAAANRPIKNIEMTLEIIKE